MLAILDLDYTLLDTVAFGRDLGLIFADCGIDRETFVETYNRTISAGRSEYAYSVERHVSLVSGRATCTDAVLAERIYAHADRASGYLFSDTRDFLERLRAGGLRTVLLTLGDESWQQRKVEASGLLPLLDETVYVESDKAAALERFAEAKPPVFVVNDNCNEIAAMMKVASGFHFLVKRSPKGLDSELDCASFDTLTEIGDEIDRLIASDL
ncbi:HAD family hydrolase [Patescibacteria group bacterium]